MHSESNSEHNQEIKAAMASAQDMHVLDILIIFLKHRKLLFFASVGAAILAAIVVLIIPSRYTAETVVLPPNQSSSMSSAILSQLGSAGGIGAAAGASLGIKNSGDMYVSLMHSRTVEDAVIQRFGLMARYQVKNMSDARSALDAHTSMMLGIKDGLITISVTDRDPKEAADIANGYVSEFRKFSANLAITEASQRRAFFQQQLLEVNESLAAAEEAMKQTEQSTGVVQIDSQSRYLLESAAELRAQIVAKEVQLQGMRTYDTEDNAQLVVVKQQLAELKFQLAKLAGTDANSSSDLLVPKGNIPGAGMEYVRKLRDVKYYETLSELMAKQFEVAKLDEAAHGTTIQVIDVAVAPDKRSFPKRSITVIVAMLCGFFLACGWSILAEGLQRMKSDPEDFKRLHALRATLRS